MNPLDREEAERARCYKELLEMVKRWEARGVAPAQACGRLACAAVGMAQAIGIKLEEMLEGITVTWETPGEN